MTIGGSLVGTCASTEEWLKGHAPVGGGATLADGTVVGRWRIVAFVARGGAGEVYRAADEAGGRTAALKMLHRTDDAARTRFKREAEVLADLDSPAFPAFFEAGEFDGRPWYATEFLQPLDMPVTDSAVARLILSVCRGAGALHALGYIHRDIKPANILSRDGEPVLIDLGLLKHVETPELHPGDTLSVVDGRPVGVGTPGYAAPEQFLGGGISPAADIHAIGVLASTCFGGKPPRAWRTIIRRATSSLTAERYPDVASLARAVRLRHFPAVFGIVALVAAIAATVAGAALLHERSDAFASSSQAAPMNQAASVIPTVVDTPPAPKDAEPPASELSAPPNANESPASPEAAPEQPAPSPVETAIQTRPEQSEPRSVDVAFQSVPEQPEPRPAGADFQAAPQGASPRDDDTPIVASPRLRQKLADQGRNLPRVTPNQIRKALATLDGGMIPIPGRDFEMCKFEMTQAIWEPIAGFNPSERKGADLPVSNVTLSDIDEFLHDLNSLPEVRATGKPYRLPTAEEWEYACLAGGTNGFCRLADGTQITEKTLGDVAWHGSNSRGKPHPVCKRQPNAFGLYDMHGNVAEWTSTTTNPGSLYDFECICKGNAYNGKKLEAFRADYSPAKIHGQSFYSLGFRLVRQAGF